LHPTPRADGIVTARGAGEHQSVSRTEMISRFMNAAKEPNTRAVMMVAAGAGLGVGSAVMTARIVVRFVPELAGESTWAVLASLPFGLFAGALMAGFLDARARYVHTFRQMLSETIAIAAVAAIAVSQLVIPVAWGLPRTTITTLIVMSAAVFAGIGAWLLKPLYWRVM